MLLLAEPGAPPRPGAAAYLERVRSDWIRMDLVVRQDAAARCPKPVHPAVAALPAALRIQLRDGRAADLHRLARLASGAARGLVLGGGGARGLAHLGVLKALDEVSCAPDFVGGTSMGAIIAASLAMGWSLAEIRAQTEAFFATSNPINDYTLPLHALTRGAKVDAGLAARYGGVRIEDLWLPFFCISSNLTNGSTMVHRTGALTQALRASIAIPGLLPPVICDAGVLVDGGMMNNLPADVAADLERGPVLAVDVGSDRAFQDMPRRGWTGRFVRRLIGAPPAMPGLAPLLLRAATVSSDAQSLMAAAHATVVLKPQLAGIDLRAWSRFRETAELGYQETRAGIASGRLARWLDPPALIRPRVAAHADAAQPCNPRGRAPIFRGETAPGARRHDPACHDPHRRPARRRSRRRIPAGGSLRPALPVDPDLPAAPARPALAGSRGLRHPRLLTEPRERSPRQTERGWTWMSRA